MLLIRHALAKLFSAKTAAALAVAFSLVSAQNAPVAPNATPPDSSLLLLQSLSAAPDSAAPAAQQPSTTAPQQPSATAAQQPSPPPQPASASALKSVLFLGGGEHSPWFHLGVLYAIESYSIPVDSIVGTSWGAYIGFLWAKGLPLDDIQRILLDPYVIEYVGHNEFDDLYKTKERVFDFPVSVNGLPSLRHRFTVAADTNGTLRRNVKPLEPDSALIRRSLAKLRLQESLYRQPAGFIIPFNVKDCDGRLSNSADDVFKTIPLKENGASTELCSYSAVPAEDNMAEFPMISVAAPITQNASNSPWNSPWQKALADRELQNLGTQPGVIIRAHTVLDTARKTWIQAGFSAMERRLSEAARLFPRKVDYAAKKRTSMPWFKFNPVLDSLSAEQQSPVKTYWNPRDTGMLAPENFANALMAEPAYDSVEFQMLPTGDLWVNASVHPTFDVFAGGFGSNAHGSNAYAGVSMAYIDQMEIEAILSGFWGGKTYGFTPRIMISRLWNKHWSFLFGYDLMHLQPLKSYAGNVDLAWRILSEERSDLHMTVDYQLTDLQKVSLDFMFGNRTYELNPTTYAKHKVNTYPVSPSIRYELRSGENDRWFVAEGFAVTGELGLQSIGLDLDMYDGIPIYWRSSVEARYSHSPTDFFTFNVAAAGGLNIYHEEGHGYVYPDTFEIKALDNTFRQRIRATPWSTEWYNPDLASHHYGLLRANAGVHYGVVGAWLFGAYVRDFEENESAKLGANKFIFEPALRFAYKSITAYAGLTRTVDSDTFDDLSKFKNYRYFVRIGNYEF